MKTPSQILAMMNAYVLSYKNHKDEFDSAYEHKDIIKAAEAQRKMQYHYGIFKTLYQIMHERNPISEEIKTVDIGLGKCKRNAHCGEWAVTFYNPDLPVCAHCQHMLEEEFEREYQ